MDAGRERDVDETWTGCGWDVDETWTKRGRNVDPGRGLDVDAGRGRTDERARLTKR